MKKVLSLVLAAVMVVSIFTGLQIQSAAFNETGELGSNITYRFNSATNTLNISGSGEMYNYDYSSENKLSPITLLDREVEINHIVIENGITTIGDSVFFGMGTLKTVSIPNTVTKIGDCAFFWCWNGPESIVIPNSVTDIGTGAFNQCGWLKSITLSNNLTHIGHYAFNITGYTTDKNNCENGGYYINNNLVKVDEGYSGTLTVKDGTTLIADYVCGDYGNDDITDVIIPDTVKYIGSHAFCFSANLESVVIGKNVKSIGESAFLCCKSLKIINIPKDVIFLSNDILNGCSALNRITVDSDNTVYDSRDNCNAIIETATNNLIIGCNGTIIPDSVTSIGKSAFEECIGLKTITIPDSVTEIGLYAFSNCSNLKELYIGKNTQIIGDYAFLDCDSLKSVTIPNNVKTIGTNAFGYKYKYNWDIDEREDLLCDDFTLTVQCDSGVSAAEMYARANSVAFNVFHTASFDGSHCIVCGTILSKINGLKCKSRTSTAQTLTWSEVKSATGYQVQISTKDGKKWDKTVTLKAGVTSYTFKKLAAGNNYKFRVRFYIKAADGKNYYSPWSATLGSPTLPTGTTLTKLTSAKKAFNAQWKKNASVNGYQVQYGLKSNFKGAKTLTVKNAKTLKAAVKKLSAKKTYYVRIRTYKTISKVNYFSTWSKTYKVKTK